MKDVYLEQFASFGAVDRDPFGRVVSVAYFALMPSDKVILRVGEEHADVAWFPVEFIPTLAYDHAEILQAALRHLKHRLTFSNAAFSLLPRTFTMTELQRLYEVILGKRLDKRNFRKRILQTGLLVSTGKNREGGANRPALLYQFSSLKSQVVKVL
jgi:8-oxo-dGTP diphosphatase